MLVPSLRGVSAYALVSLLVSCSDSGSSREARDLRELRQRRSGSASAAFAFDTFIQRPAAGMQARAEVVFNGDRHFAVWEDWRDGTRIWSQSFDRTGQPIGVAKPSSASRGNRSIPH